MGSAQLILLGICALIGLGESLVAYDCGAPTMNMTTLSLTDIKGCEVPINNPEKITTEVQLLQAAELSSIHVIQCKIEIHRSIYHCGMHSHISIVSNAHAQYISETTYDICRQMHETRTYRSHDQYHTSLNANGTTDRPLKLAGRVDSEGNCKGSSFSDFYGSWDDVVVIGQIFITLQDYYTTVQVDKNEIILRSGVRCTYSKGSCMDVEGGNTYWNIIPMDQCKADKFSLLYQGSAQRIKDKSFNNYAQEIYSLTTEEITFALSVRGIIQICGYQLIKTEHPKLFIMDRSKGSFFTYKNRITTPNMDILTYVNSKFVYLEQHLKGQITALYNNVIVQQCELEKQMLHNALAMAPIAPAEFAYHFMKQAGYIAHITGETIRIAKCVPVDVKIRKTKECFQELPVYRGNESLYMLPRTHILVHTGNQIECNTFLAPMFHLNNEWIQMMPQVAPAVAPERISAQTQTSWKYSSPSNLATGGIYSADDLEKLRETMMFPLEKTAVLHTLAREATGQESIRQGISIATLMDEKIVKETIQKVWGKMTSFFNTIGTYGVTLMGIWMVIRFIKFSVDIIVHGYALHTIFGWSLWLLGAVWDSVTNLLIHLNRDRSKVKDAEKGLTIEDEQNNKIEETNDKKTEQAEIKTLSETPTTSQIYPAFNNTPYNTNQTTTTPYTPKVY